MAIANFASIIGVLILTVVIVYFVSAAIFGKIIEHFRAVWFALYLEKGNILNLLTYLIGSGISDNPLEKTDVRIFYEFVVTATCSRMGYLANICREASQKEEFVQSVRDHFGFKAMEYQRSFEGVRPFYEARVSLFQTKPYLATFMPLLEPYSAEEMKRDTR